MKTKIFNFILMTAFVLSAVRCNVDEKNDVTVPAVSAVALKAQSQSSHIYTDQEKEQVRKNVQGHFQGTLNSTIGGLEIKENNLILTTFSKEGKLISTSSSYTVAFDNNKPVLIFEAWSVRYELNILFVWNGITDVGGFSANDYTKAYFDRFEGGGR